MPKKHNHLFEEIASFRALHVAAMRAICGKRSKPGAAGFMANIEKNLLRIERALREGSWRGGGYTIIDVREPKPRMVSAAPFADRVVHHALCNIVAPIFERGFIADSYANRKGFGTHRAIARYESFQNRYRHVLRCDIYRYFPSIHANTWRLRRTLFSGGWFDPSREPDRPPVGRALRGGSWNNTPQNVRASYRNNNEPANRNNNNGFRLASMPSRGQSR